MKATLPKHPFPLLGSGTAIYRESASLLVWFEAPLESESVDAIVAELPAVFQSVRNQHGPALVVETDDTLAPSTASWKALGQEMAEALLRIHARAPIAFAARELAGEGGHDFDALHAWSVKQAVILDRLCADDAPWEAVRSALFFVGPYLGNAPTRRLRDFLLRRLDPIISARGERARAELSFYAELLDDLPRKERDRRIAALSAELRLAYALLSFERLGEFAESAESGTLIERARNAEVATGSPVGRLASDLRRLTDRLMAYAMRRAPKQRARSLATARACLGAATVVEPVPERGWIATHSLRLCSMEGKFDEALRHLATAAEEAPAAEDEDPELGEAVGTALAEATRLSHRGMVEACLDLAVKHREVLGDRIFVANLLTELVGRSRFVEAASVARTYVEDHRGADGLLRYKMTPALYTNIVLAFAYAADTSEAAEHAAAEVSALLTEEDGKYFTEEIPLPRDLRGSAHAWLGLWFASKGDIDQAVERLTRARELGYADLSLLRNSPILTPHLNTPALKGIFEGGEDFVLAEKNRQVRENPRDWFAIFSRGLFHQEHGDLVRAIADYEKTIELNPSYPDTYVNMGNIHWTRDRNFPEAIRWYDQALARAEGHYLARLNRAEARLHTGAAAGTLEDARRALEIQKTAHAHYLCALAHADLGETAPAVKAARAGAALDKSMSSIDEAPWRERLRAMFG